MISSSTVAVRRLPEVVNAKPHRNKTTGLWKLRLSLSCSESRPAQPMKIAPSHHRDAVVFMPLLYAGHSRDIPGFRRGGARSRGVAGALLRILRHSHHQAAGRASGRNHTAAVGCGSVGHQLRGNVSYGDNNTERTSSLLPVASRPYAQRRSPRGFFFLAPAHDKGWLWCRQRRALCQCR